MEKNTDGSDVNNTDVNNVNNNDLEKINLANQGKIIAEQKHALTLATQEKQDLMNKIKQLEDITNQSQKNVNDINQTLLNNQQNNPDISSDLSEMKAMLDYQRKLKKEQELKPMYETLDLYNVAVDDRANLFEGIKTLYDVDLLAHPNPELFQVIMRAEQGKVDRQTKLPGGLNGEFVNALDSQKQQELRQTQVNDLAKQQFNAYAMSKGKK